jgi:5-methylthioadenosine/S-adenosylhomocysteine deaminase
MNAHQPIAVPHSADVLIRDVDVVCLDERKTVLERGAVAVSNGRIDWIGPSAQSTQCRASETIEGAGRILMPGLIDAHFHTAQQLLRGKIVEIGRKRPVKSPVWRQYYIPFESILDPEDIYLSALLAYTDMISVGTTCFAEAGGPHPDEMARAALEVGIRGFVALSTIDRGSALPTSMRLTREEALRQNVELVQRWHSNDRVKASLAMRQILVCTPQLIRDLGQAARDLDTFVHTHLAEGTYEIDYVVEKHALRPPAFLDSIGALDRHWHCAHAVLMSPGDIDLFARNRASACHCAFNNYHIGAPRALEMFQRGIPIGLGTDGAAAWGTLDIFQVAHAARIGQQLISGTPTHHRNMADSEDLLRMATNGGARALRLEADIGSIEVGKKADLILIGNTHLDQIPAHDALFTAANIVTGRDVQTVLVDGRVILREGQFASIDIEQLRARVLERVPQIMERFEALAL